MVNRHVGLTKDAGWQVGARKKVNAPAALLWELVTSPAGFEVWLGEQPGFIIKKDAEFVMADGTKGAVTTFVPNSHLRMTWQPLHYPRASILQVRIIPHPTGSVMAFHQEHLPDEAARKERKVFFLRALEKLVSILDQKDEK